MKDVPYKEQLNTSDASFVENLRLPGEHGERLAEARRAGDADAAAVVAAYFRTRKGAKWAYYMHGTPWHETDAPGSVIEKSERLLNNGFFNSWPPHKKFELGEPGGDTDWKRGLEHAGTAISRWAFIAELSTAFALTGDERYPRRAMELARSYVQQLPFNLEARFEEDHDTYFGGPSNQTLSVAYRMFRMTDFLHSGAFNARRADGAYLLSDADIFWLVKQIWFYASQYYRLVGDKRRRDNHHLVDHGHTPFVIGMAFPEFAISAELAKEGAAVIQFHFGSNLLKDGAYSEHSAEYQYHIIFHYLHPMAVAQANGMRLFTEQQASALRKWVQFSVHAVKPNGWLPGIGDSGGRPIVHLLGALASPVMTPELASVAKSLGIWPGKNVNSSMAEIERRMSKLKPGEPGKIGLSAYFLSKDKQARGVCREATSSHYPFGGYTFFRSGWTPDADYLSLSHFPANIIGGHAHFDPLSFILHTKGRTLIGEPASQLYGDVKFHGHGGESPERSSQGNQRRLYRGYTYSPQSHNCLIMNDDFLKNLEAFNHGTFWGGYPPICHSGIFAAGGPIEVVELWHDANAPTRMRRFALHLKGIGFALVDIVSCPKLRLSPMQYSQYFHFEGDVEISPEVPANGGAMKAFLDDASCVIVPGGEVETRWRSYRDEFLHDLYMVPTTKGLPWVAELTRRIRGNGVFATFMLTRDGAAPAIRYLGAKASEFFDWQHDGVSVNRLDLGAAGSVLLASSPFGKEIATPEIATNAELAVAVLDGAGKVKSWGVARGSRLSVGGRSLLAGRLREWAASK